MSRGLLSDDELATIAEQLPNTEGSMTLVHSFDPNFIALGHGVDSLLPVAVVCLHDASQMIQEARHALHEAIAHRMYYRPKQNEPAVVWFGRYYCADVALRLFAAGEHFANALVAMLGIDEKDLAPYKGRVISRQIVVGRYMVANRPADTLTPIIKALVQSDDWKATVAYRNAWVHEQAPTVSDLGLVWRRRGCRWRSVPSAGSGVRVLTIGGGDVPETTIDKLILQVSEATGLFVKAFDGLVDRFAQIVAD
jgi:hypothetical protein